MRTERYFTLRLRAIWRPRLSASRLCYNPTECQYQGIVKVPGLFVLLRLTSIFTRTAISPSSWSETVGKSLRHSCRSELTRQRNFATLGWL